MNFPDFLGNDQVKTALSAAFALRRFPHAVAILGEAGCGKRTFAKLVASALVCRDREHAPCGVCPSCIRAAAGSHPDIRVIEGTGASRAITVDAVKSVIADAYRVPEEADVSVYILLLGGRTADGAQNKLLKIIEEPPQGVVFLLVCESAEQLLPTIRSRVQSFTLRPPSLEEAASWIKQKAEIDSGRARELASLCSGNIGRMLEELEGGEAARSQALAAEIAAAMMDRTGDRLMKAMVPLQKDKQLCREVLSRLAVIFRDACTLRMGGNRVLGGALQEAELLEGLPMKQLSGLPDTAEEFRRLVDRNANMSLMTACLFSRLREAAAR